MHLRRNGNRSKKSVHSGKDLRDKNDEGKSQLMNSINQHFSSKNKSEVNEGILAFLTAETCFQNLPRLGKFSANMHLHESNFFGLPIKMRLYNATTWPTD
ncbi:GH16128 [Drosophila grimshawi]|uniref:GH16128 n=1 Tax=Drosophila grimshawi TaxID=7222 RepID=B4J3K6_DROGR|nr:GH16128 [Drosophila grimshawi]